MNMKTGCAQRTFHSQLTALTACACYWRKVQLCTVLVSLPAQGENHQHANQLALTQCINIHRCEIMFTAACLTFLTEIQPCSSLTELQQPLNLRGKSYQESNAVFHNLQAKQYRHKLLSSQGH